MDKVVEKEVDKKIRAIYIGDLRFDNCPVFELNVETHMFVMISDIGKDLECGPTQYEDLYVYADENFLIFEVITEDSNILKRGSTIEYEKVEYVKKI